MDYSKISKLLANHSPAGLAKIITDGAYKVPPHIKLINSHLVDLLEAKRQRIIVNLPPRHGKSQIISTYFPTWYLGRKPDNKIMLASYSKELALGWGRECRDLYAEHGLRYFNNTVSRGMATATLWGINKKAGQMFSTGIAAGGTGRGFNVMIIDDPVKDAIEAFSPVIRERVWSWFQSVAVTRKAPNASIVLVMTRWHHDDLAGRIIERSQDDWTILNIPAIAKDNDILGRKPGEALWPEMFPIDELENTKKEIGSYWFSALYQQEPIANDYQIFKPEWWQLYDEDPNTFKSKCSIIYFTMDTAFKEGELNDYSVCIVWGVYDGKLYVLDMWRDKILYPDLVARTINYKEMYKPKFIFIEDAASGQSLVPDLKRRWKGQNITIKEVETMNKQIRAHTVSPTIEQGLIYLPKNAPFLTEFINEFSQFPAAAHDDIVDAGGIGIQKFIEKFKNYGLAPKTPVQVTERIGLRREGSARRSGNNKYSGY